MEQSLAAASELDFSVLALFMRSTLTVKLVMIVLVIASIWSWAIIINKFLQFRNAKSSTANFVDEFWSGVPLDDLHRKLGKDPKQPIEQVFVAGMNEWRRSHDKDGHVVDGAIDRIDRAMNVALISARDKWDSGLNILSSVGAIAPFIGLLGTVWGIKTAFQDIALAQNTNLAVVAPGIAEALVATALGLLAAIPAVIFYNKYISDVDKLVDEHESFADEFSVILSRQIELDK